MATKQAKLKEQAYASKLKSRALSVLLYLIDHSNQELTCFPAIPTMAGQLHISVSTVKRALRELVDAGYISKDARFREKNRGQSSNLYTLVLWEGQPEDRDKENTVAGGDIEPDIENSPNTGDGQNQDIPTSMPQGRKTEHISFDTLKMERKEEPEGLQSKEAVPVGCHLGERETVAVDRQIKEAGTMETDCWFRKPDAVSKLKRPSRTPGDLEDHTRVCFGLGDHLRGAFSLGSGQTTNGGMGAYPSCGIPFFSWTGEGVSLMPP